MKKKMSIFLFGTSVLVKVKIFLDLDPVAITYAGMTHGSPKMWIVQHNISCDYGFKVV